jgi:hypothetical protein
MIPKLPRELLWTDKTSMDEFFELDPVNEYFYEYYISLREEPFAVTLDPVKVFNEVYYQATRAAYEKPYMFGIAPYFQDIKANLGWNYSAELVMSMLYWIFEASDSINLKKRNYFKDFIKLQCSGCIYWQTFQKCYQLLKRKKICLKYRFAPKPVSTHYLRNKYIYWSDITRNYDLVTTRCTIELWDNEEDRSEVAAMIKGSLGKGAVIKRYGADDATVINLLDGYIKNNSSFVYTNPSQYIDNRYLEVRIKQLEMVNHAKQSRIDELEADNNRLNALLEKKKINGKARKFTLVQMVDYCKDCVEWDDVKSIVAMLNKLLRRIGTDEDSDLVDSIEEEFKYRKYGDYIMGDKNEFSGNSSHNTIKLPPGMTPQEAMKLLQNKSKDNGEER